MRPIKLLFLLLLPLFCSSQSLPPDTQVRVNGRVALYESVLRECNGDTLSADAISIPIPVKSSYLSRERIMMEKLYNRIHPGILCLMVSAICCLLCIRGKKRLLYGMLWILFLTEGADFVFNWVLTGSLPIQTGADTFSAVALAISIVILTYYKKWNVSVICLAALLAGLLSVPGNFLGNHPAVRAINPSLNSGWLMIHVPLMISSYSLFLFATVASIVTNPGKWIFRCILWGEILLGAGIVCGALWAADAWGRFWAWDPKETAALVTFLIYLAVLALWNKTGQTQYVRRLMIMSGAIALIFTWLFITSGLHSY